MITLALFTTVMATHQYSKLIYSQYYAYDNGLSSYYVSYNPDTNLNFQEYKDQYGRTYTSTYYDLFNQVVLNYDYMNYNTYSGYKPTGSEYSY